MANVVRRVTLFSSIVVLSTLAIAQENQRILSNSGKGGIASVEEPDFTRFRVVTDDGILAVFDADEDWDGRDEPISQLAYWHDLATEQLFFFDQLLFTDADVLQSVAAMQRDLNIDPAQLLSEMPELDPLPEITSPGQWRPAIEIDVLTVMAGGIPSAHEGGEVSGLAYPCVPSNNCIALRGTTGSLPGPVRGTLSSELFAMAQRGSNCTCGGGGGCGLTTGPCVYHDNDPCTSDVGVCVSGICVLGATNAPCEDDGQPCTTDVCSNKVCTHPQKANGTACPEDTPIPKECTQDACEGGECKHKAEPLEGAACNTDNINCTNDVCRAGECKHENGGCPGDPCANSGNCVADNNPCTLPPYCDPMFGCVEQAVNCDDGDACSTDRCQPEDGACQHIKFSDPLSAQDSCEEHGCSISGLPTTILLNNDDDNGNGHPDYEDVGAVANENDIVCVSVSSPGCPPPSGSGCSPYHGCEFDHWHPLQLPGVALYASMNRDPLPINVPCPTWPLPSQWCLEGRTASGTCPEGFDFQVVGYAPGSESCCRWRSPPVSVVKIQSLTWEKAYPSNDPVNQVDLENCPNNGGKRIFPDKLNKDDEFPSLRQQVKLVATITPAKADIPVYFQLFDVDDPFDQLHGPNTGLPDPNSNTKGNQEIIPDVTLIDSNRNGGDNGPTGQPDPAFTNGATFIIPTVLEPDPQGGTRAVAKRTITVSMQPGNNYRAAASLLPNVVDGSQPQITQTTADDLSVMTDVNGQFIRAAGEPGYKCPATWSPMLTVWRKLHIETDTMVRPTFAQNTFNMPWSNARQGPAQTQVLVDVQDPPSAILMTASAQFNIGLIELQDITGNFIVRRPIQDYTTNEDIFGNNPPDTVKINIPSCANNQSGLACLGGLVGGIALLSDDDLTNDVTFAARAWGCDDSYSNPVASLSPPDLSLLQERYRLAYIEPVHDTQASAVQGIVTFIRNVDSDNNNGKILWNQALAARNLPVSTSSFWTAMVVSGWQADEPEDADPGSEDTVGNGVTKGVSTHPASVLTGNTSTVGFEAPYTGMCAVFKAVFGESTYADYEKYTIVHEVGHGFGLDHGDDGAMCAIGDCQREPFRAISLKKLREYVSP